MVMITITMSPDVVIGVDTEYKHQRGSLKLKVNYVPVPLLQG